MDQDATAVEAFKTALRSELSKASEWSDAIYNLDMIPSPGSKRDTWAGDVFIVKKADNKQLRVAAFVVTSETLPWMESYSMEIVWGDEPDDKSASGPVAIDGSVITPRGASHLTLLKATPAPSFQQFLERSTAVFLERLALARW